LAGFTDCLPNIEPVGLNDCGNLLVDTSLDFPVKEFERLPPTPFMPLPFAMIVSYVYGGPLSDVFRGIVMERVSPSGISKS
jgi:hypothetical protein